MARTLTVPEAPPIVKGRTYRMSYEEFLALPHNLHAEWVDGEVYVFMPPSEEHHDTIALLYRLLSTFVRMFDLGKAMFAPFEVVTRPGRSYREPDLFFVAKQHLDRLTRERLTEPIDLVVEVVSPDSVTRDRRDKFREYEAIGVREYWLFDPRPRQRQAEFYRLNAAGAYEPIPPDDQGRIHSEVLPGFWLRPEWFWRDPPPDPDALLMEIAPEAMRARFARLMGNDPDVR